MAKTIQTYSVTESDILSRGSPPSVSGSKWDVTIADTNNQAISVTGDNFTVNYPTIMVKRSTNVGVKKYACANFRSVLKNASGTTLWSLRQRRPQDITSIWSTVLTQGTEYQVYRRSDVSDGSYTATTSNYFNSTNKDVRTVYLTWSTYLDSGELTSSDNLLLRGLYSRASASSYEVIAYTQSTKTTTWTVPVTLNAPPAIDSTHNTASAISYTKYGTSTSASYVYTGLTRANVTVSNLSAKYNGVIKQVTLKIGTQTKSVTNNNGLSGSQSLYIDLTTAGKFTPTLTFTDSRGQTATRTLTDITVNQYTKPTVSFSAQRTDSSGVAGDEETSAVVTAKFSYTSITGGNTLAAPTVSVKNKNGTSISGLSITWYSNRALTDAVSDWSLVANNATLYALITDTDNDSATPFDTQTSYDIAITPNDSSSSGTAKTVSLNSAYYTIDFLAGGHGIAFGQACTDEGFYCNMDANFKDKAGVMRAMFDFFYPVGSYYETSNTSFDPNVSWGGTWSLEAAGKFHISAGTGYTAGGTGGSAYIQAHTHSFTQPTVKTPTLTANNSNYVRIATEISSINRQMSGTDGGTYRYLRYVAEGASIAKAAPTIAAGATCTVTSGAVGAVSGATTGSAGNLPPYVAVNRWHRTA